MTFNEIGYILLIFAELLALGWAAVYMSSHLFSWLKGTPYVRTSQNEMLKILKECNLRKNDYFLELGCGDGRVLRTAAAKYGVVGEGIDINPILILKARFFAGYQRLHKLNFKIRDITHADLGRADFIYIFLFPKLIEKLQNHIVDKTKTGTVIISHAFPIPYLQSSEIKKITGEKFTTFYYRLAQK